MPRWSRGLLVAWFVAACSLSGTAARAEPAGPGGEPAGPGGAVPSDDPLRRDYVDFGIQGGPVWLGSVGDNRWSPVGSGFGVRIAGGRAPYWGCVYVDVSFFSARDGVLDPANNERPDLLLTSAGWCGKAAIRLGPRFYLYPMIGAGFAVLDYSSGSGKFGHDDLIQVRLLGLGIQAEATLAYTWRYVALTLQPIRATAYLHETIDTYQNVSSSGLGTAFGLSRNGLSVGASIGVSVNLSGIALGMFDSVRGVVRGW